MIGRRLQAIVDGIEGTCLADIGCDHALLCVDALRQNKVSKAYACDIAQGPLNRARRTIQTYRYEDKISCLLMDGMQKLPKDVDIVVIAGMGSKTIQHILSTADVPLDMHLLLSPHTDAAGLRLYLVHNGYTITAERFVYEEAHYYPIMKVIHKDTAQKLTPFETYYGKNCIEEEDYLAYLYHMEAKYQKLLLQIPKDKQAHIQKQLAILKSSNHRI